MMEKSAKFETLVSMGRDSLQGVEFRKDVVFSSSGIKLQPFPQECNFGRERIRARGLFASVNQVGNGFGISSNALENVTSMTTLASDLQMKFVSVAESAFPVTRSPELLVGDVLEIEEKESLKKKKKKKTSFKWQIKIKNPALRRLISGGIAGAVSRTAVAPLETVRTHLMVGSCGNSSTEVFNTIMKTDGWKGLFRGNLINVIRVAPSKAIELFIYDTVVKKLSPKSGEESKLPVPASSIAGALAGVSSTLCTYPLELVKTRLTVQRGVYKNLFDAFLKIAQEEGPGELYRGLTPSLIGVIPYAAANYCAYDMLRKTYKKVFKKEEIGNVMTLLIGSAAGAISSTATFPLEVARKHMQAGALNGRQYQNMLHALASILEEEGLAGLYRGLGPSCIKIVPAAGISFMCYEACKRILIMEEEDS